MVSLLLPLPFILPRLPGALPRSSLMRPCALLLLESRSSTLPNRPTTPPACVLPRIALPPASITTLLSRVTFFLYLPFSLYTFPWTFSTCPIDDLYVYTAPYGVTAVRRGGNRNVDCFTRRQMSVSMLPVAPLRRPLARHLSL
jgi:hypothetical protein